MSSRGELSRAEKILVESLLRHYSHQQGQVSLFRDQLLLALSSSSMLGSLIHSIRSRIKDPDHLRDKLIRKLNKSKQQGIGFDVTPDNLLIKVTDLVGARILHLYTRQIREIDIALRAILHENRYELIEGPFARTW